MKNEESKSEQYRKTSEVLSNLQGLRLQQAKGFHRTPKTLPKYFGGLIFMQNVKNEKKAKFKVYRNV